MTNFSRRGFLGFSLGATATVVTLSPLAAMAADAVRVKFILSNDLYKISEDNKRGGFARLKSILKAEREGESNTLFFHAGDAISPSMMSGFDQGESMIDCMNALDIQAFTPGNHEFDFGSEIFLKRMSEAKFPLLASNLTLANGELPPGFGRSKTIEIGGIRIGIIGATLDITPVISSPGDLKFSSTMDSVAKEAKLLRSQGVDFIVALVHADRETDMKLAESRLVDLVLTGHDHDLRIIYDGKVAMMESGEDAQFVTIADVSMELKVEGANRGLRWSPHFRVIETSDATPDPDMANKVKSYEAKLSKELDIEIATLPEGLDSRSAMVRSRETAIGNLVADALRAVSHADIAITNGGGIRANKEYAAGSKLTRRDVLSELPFGNRSVVTSVTGAAVKSALENGLSQVENKTGRFPQVSGISVVYDPSKPAGQRVVSVLVGGQPLDEAKTYKIATNDYMLKGGDGYNSLRGGTKDLDVAGNLMANDVMDFAEKQKFISGKIEGRIKAL
ncbi:MAG: bifunctional metallophosphatase/5'-nucleotidase [Methylocystaceae bacterium]|nr:bifunctional metallophosphatase/5'-nucleotidase [Methylocystaceae bacterium]